MRLPAHQLLEIITLDNLKGISNLPNCGGETGSSFEHVQCGILFSFLVYASKINCQVQVRSGSYSVPVRSLLDSQLQNKSFNQ